MQLLLSPELSTTKNLSETTKIIIYSKKLFFTVLHLSRLIFMSNFVKKSLVGFEPGSLGSIVERSTTQTDTYVSKIQTLKVLPFPVLWRRAGGLITSSSRVSSVLIVAVP